MTPIERSKAAQQYTGYGPIALRREGQYVVVEINWRNRWIEVIREHVDSNFSHIVEPLGIQEEIASRSGMRSFL